MPSSYETNTNNIDQFESHSFLTYILYIHLQVQEHSIEYRKYIEQLFSVTFEVCFTLCLYFSQPLYQKLQAFRTKANCVNLKNNNQTKASLLI